MICSNCGNDFNGNFCDKCGASAPKTESSFVQKIKSSFIEPEENLISVLGSNMAKTFFTTGVLGNGFAILSDKRMYFKGRCYIRKGKGFFKKMEEKVVDLDNITGSGFVHNQSILTTALYYATLVLVSLLGLCSMVALPGPLLVCGFSILALPFWLIHSFTKKEWARIIAFTLCCIASYGIVGICYILHKAFNYSLFEVSYAGGGIAFELNWITKEDSDNFQKKLQKTKSDYISKKQQEAKNVVILPSSDSDKEKSIPKLLKEYKELLDNGIITQEEFDTKKQHLLNK